MSEAPSPSRQKTVLQAAVLISILLLCAIFAFAALRGGPQVMPPRAEAPPPPAADATPRAFAETIAPYQLAATLAASSGAPGGSDADPDPLAAVLERMSNQGAAAAPAPAPEPRVDPLHNKAVEARSSALKGAVDYRPSVADAAGGAGQGGASTLPPGTVIEGNLVQSVSSDYPGAPWVAQVSRPVYFRSGGIAIPAGSILMGSVEQDRGPNSVIQGRAGLRLSRLVRPDGVDVELAAPVLDAAGIAAIPGPTNRHVVAQAAGVLASALLGAARLGTASDEPISARSQIEQDAMQGAAQQTAPVAQRYLTVQPTVVPPAGTPVRVRLLEPVNLPPNVEV